MTKRLSLWRVAFASFLLGSATYVGIIRLQRHQEISSPSIPPAWFAGYVDATATPIYPFEQLGSASPSAVVLSFIVSSPASACEPTWGTHYTLDQAAITLDMDRRIARFRQQGGQISISFGGALNDELAVKCTDPNQLLKAYQTVVDRYSLDTVDLDLENVGLTNSEAVIRRSQVIAQLQKHQRDEGKSLAVWLTLPVSPHGLTPEGTTAVAEALKAGIDLAGINVMTMDYGESKPASQSMSDASLQAIKETHRQLGVIYQKAGITLNSVSLWRKIGLTPMIGQNDVVDEVFTVTDAQTVNQFAQSLGVGRISMWSYNRDIPCGENYTQLKRVSTSCSGVKDPKLSFFKALSQGFSGDISHHAKNRTTPDVLATPIPDDPSKSPYQIWQETGVYPKGVKVVWHGHVYEAKWWTKNDLPDNPVLQAWETPWQLIGPVLPGEKPVVQPTLPKGTYPAWSGTEIYEGGERVLFDGIPYQAKWWNQGQSPAASAANPDNSPWLPLSQTEIEHILSTLKKP